jgi:hypothetical protein
LANGFGLVKLPAIADMTLPARFGLDGDGGINFFSRFRQRVRNA